MTAALDKSESRHLVFVARDRYPSEPKRQTIATRRRRLPRVKRLAGCAAISIGDSIVYYCGPAPAKRRMGLRSKLRIRTRLRSVFSRIFRARTEPGILGYHRVADKTIDPWTLAVSPTHFEEQLRVLRRTRRPFSLTEFVGRLVAGELPPNAVALTFDDGYVDNLTAARPRLSAADIPATVFLATGYLGRGQPFWWDELARLILSDGAPSSFELVVRGEAMRIDVDAGTPEHAGGATKSRRAALWRIWQTLRRLEDEERRRVMTKLALVFARRDLRRRRAAR